MAEETLVTYCAPTLAGLKTANLFAWPYASRAELMQDVRRINRELGPKGLRLLPMSFRDGRALLYLYRPHALARDLSAEQAVRLLQEIGYPVGQPNRLLVELKRRLLGSQTFPHEIGLFLSYPPEDVRGFIEHHAKDSKCTGTWKVYGDEQTAKEKFRQFAHCTEVYCRRSAQGFPLSQLAVAEKYA